MNVRMTGIVGMKKTRIKVHTVTIKDCDVETFSVGGAGGSGKDTSNSGVRIRHLPSGAVGMSVDSRSQRQNKETAFRRMGESKAFQQWARRHAASTSPPVDIAAAVEDWMKPEHLRVEYQTPDGYQIWEE
jgi:protein subunit release factor A